MSALISLKNLDVGYTKVIQHIENFIFEDNKIYGILGTSGIGKTTLLKTLAGLIRPLNGEILYSVSLKNIFMMHQQYTSFDWWRVLDNILVVDDVKRNKITNDEIEKAKELLNKVGLNGYEERYPKQLSGGQRQRLALARAIYAEPRVLLMDEPLSALDEDTRWKMQDLILNFHKEQYNTIIMVTHSSSEAQKMCNQIIKLGKEDI